MTRNKAGSLDRCTEDRGGNAVKSIATMMRIAMIGLLATSWGRVLAQEASPVSSPATSSSAGTMFRFDLARTGSVRVSVVAVALTERLRIPIKTQVSDQGTRDSPSSIVVADGRLFVSDAFRFHAFDASTGT